MGSQFENETKNWDEEREGMWEQAAAAGIYEERERMQEQAAAAVGISASRRQNRRYLRDYRLQLHGAAQGQPR
jgi:hypothetical protein